MTAQIVAIGDEILIGQTLDTNSNYIAKNLTAEGIQVLSIQTIADNADVIRNILAHPDADVVIFTGGLGPTKDDITKKTVSQFFNSPLVESKEVLDNVADLMARRGRTELNELNKQQALIPKDSTVLMNKVGTAPGMWVEDNNRIFIFMPGIPFETKYLLQNEVLPRLRNRNKEQQEYRKNLIVFNIPESELALQLEEWENALPSSVSFAYLPTAGIVKMRLTVKGKTEEEAEEILAKETANLQNILGNALISTDGEDLASMVGALLKEKKLSISTAESFTTGRIITELCSVSGSSAYVKGGLVPYEVSAKATILKVDDSLIKEHKVVSEEMAKEMAENVSKLFQSDIAISSTGVAGPSTDENHKEIGTAWVGIKIKDSIYAKKFFYPNLERNDFAQLVSKKSLEWLFKLLRDS